MWNGFSIYFVTYIAYNFQHFESIEYINGLSWTSLFTFFQANDPKIHIDLDDFSSFLELMMQKPQIQFSQLITSFYWNEKLYPTLMEILNNNWYSQLQYVVSLFNSFYNTNVTKK
jgi:hypothetical protein